MSNNVITFPLTYESILPQSQEDAKLRLQAMQYVYIDEVASQVVQTMAKQLTIAGFEVLDEEKDFGMLIETVRSIMAKTYGVYHPFQDIAQNVLTDADEEGSMEIVPSINVKFQHDESEDEEETEDRDVEGSRT